MNKHGFCVWIVQTAVFFLIGANAAYAQNYYMDLHVGYNVVDSGDLDYASGTLSTGYEQRPAFGGSFGYLDPSGMRIEGELTYRNNDLDYIGGANASGELVGLGLMVNVLYELQLGGGSGYGYGRNTANPLRPYIGVGGGGARYTMNASVDLAAGDIVDDFTYALAYQGIVGVGVEISETALLSLDFRYLVSDNMKFDDAGGTPFEIDLVDATAMLGLRTSF